MIINDRALKPAQIKRLFGIDQRTLKTMRTNPKSNGGDVPEFFTVCERPHYPADKFDVWFKRQKNKKAKSDFKVVKDNRA